MTFAPIRKYAADHPAMKVHAQWICGKCGIGNQAVSNCTKCNKPRTIFA